MSVSLARKACMVYGLAFCRRIRVSPMPVSDVTLKVSSGFAAGLCGLAVEKVSRERKREEFWGKGSVVICTEILAS